MTMLMRLRWSIPTGAAISRHARHSMTMMGTSSSWIGRHELPTGIPRPLDRQPFWSR